MRFYYCDKDTIELYTSIILSRVDIVSFDGIAELHFPDIFLWVEKT